MFYAVWLYRNTEYFKIYKLSPIHFHCSLISVTQIYAFFIPLSSDAS